MEGTGLKAVEFKLPKEEVCVEKPPLLTTVEKTLQRLGVQVDLILR